MPADAPPDAAAAGNPTRVPTACGSAAAPDTAASDTFACGIAGTAPDAAAGDAPGGAALARETLGVVLAGGLARRMGGGDKPLHRLGGTTLLDRVLAVLRPQVAAVLLNANGDPARFAPWNLPVAADDLPDHPGPLAGVLAGLDWAAAHRPDLSWVATVSGDCPFLPADLVARLHRAREAAGVPLACAASDGQTHPPVALWPVSLRDALRAAILAGERKIDRWTARHGCATAHWAAAPLDPFFNANTPDDLALAEARLRDAGTAPTTGGHNGTGTPPA